MSTIVVLLWWWSHLSSLRLPRLEPLVLVSDSALWKKYLGRSEAVVPAPFAPSSIPPPRAGEAQRDVRATERESCSRMRGTTGKAARANVGAAFKEGREY